MKKSILSKLPMIAVGAVVPLLGLAGCGIEQQGAAGFQTKDQNVLLPKRQHYEIIDPQDGLFVSYWEKYYDQGQGKMDLFPNGYRSDVDYTAAGLPGNTNMVSGKGKRYCYGETLNWTVVSKSPTRHALGVYGWLENPLVEYYIGRGDQGGDFDAGVYNTSRGRYRLWVQGYARANVINPENDMSRRQEFLMYNLESLDGADPEVGPVNLSEHFAAWDVLMPTFWASADGQALAAVGHTWNPLVKANYCIVGAELYGNVIGHAEVSNITVTANLPQTIDGSCDGVDNDGNGTADEDWTSGFCILPPEHPSCGNGTFFGTTRCTAGVETCVSDVAAVADPCNGADDNCDGVFDEDFTPGSRDCGTEVGRCQNTETSYCDGTLGETWGVCEDGPDPIPEEPCDNEDDDCDGRTDEGSINLPARCVWDRDEDGIEDGIDTQPDVFSDEFAENDFGLTTGEIVDRGGQVVVVFNPLGDAGVWVQTLPSGDTTPAEISLCGGTVTLTMGPDEQEVVTCPETSCLFATQQLRLIDRTEVYADFYAGSFLLQWDAKVFAHGLSPGNGNLWDRAKITLGADVGGTVSGNKAGITPLVENASVAPQALTEFSIVSSGTNVPVGQNGTVPISPGSYGDVTIGQNGTLVLNAAGTYKFRSLSSAINAKIDMTAAGTNGVVIAVQGNITLGDNFRVLGNPELDIYANGTSVVLGYDTILTADLMAPFAHVEAKDRTRFYGCLGGRNVTLGYDNKFYGDTPGPGPGPGPAVLSAKLTKTNDWGGDYCMTIDVTNSGGTAVGWTATVNTNGSTIYNRWNGTFSGTWGSVTAVPNQTYNIVIDPGETDTSVGFCAHRNAPGQTATFVSIVPN